MKHCPIAFLITILLATCCRATCCRAAGPTATLTSRLGDQLQGQWLALDRSDTIQWQSPGFAQPFFIRADDIVSIRMNGLPQVPSVPGAWAFHLVDQSVVSGDLLDVSQDAFRIQLPDGQPIAIRRSALRAMMRLHDANPRLNLLDYGLKSWRTSAGEWQEVLGSFVSTSANASVELGVVFPVRFDALIELSWPEKPDFVLRMATGDGDKNGIRLETVDGSICVVVESEDQADILSVAELDHKPGKLTLHFLADIAAGKLLVCDGGNRVLGELFLSNTRCGGVYCTDRSPRGGLRVEKLQVRSWDGTPPRQWNDRQVGIVGVDGKFTEGRVTEFDAARAELRLDDVGIQISSIDCVLFGQPENSADQGWQLATHDGTRLAGQYLRAQGGKIWLRTPALENPIGFDLADVQSMTLLDQPVIPTLQAELAALEKSQDRWQKLSLKDGTQICGSLQAASMSGTAHGLAWQPKVALAGESFVTEVVGVIQLTPPKKDRQAPVVEKTTAAKSDLVNALAQLFVQGGAAKAPRAPTVSASERSIPQPGPAIYLWNGDCIGCQVVRMDDKVVVIQMKDAEERAIPHAKIRAVVLSPDYQAAKTTATKRQRLLTVPRIQKDRPPTHLLVSTDGDLLRTRVTSMDSSNVYVEIRLSAKKIPRENVAAISWLRPLGDEEPVSDNESTSELPEDHSDRHLLRVQAVWPDGRRLSFYPERLAARTSHASLSSPDILAGNDPVLGPIRVALNELSQLRLGASSANADNSKATELALLPAVEPAYLDEEGTTGRMPGQESALVGQPAPPLKLNTLDGKPFSWSQCQGKIVILDFWASWCGPCVQWMPQLEEIVRGYDSEQVQLITVNLSEDKETIQRMLDRLKINPIVVMDLDGVAAEAYEANAIPQTVIVDQAGNIARLYIGAPSQIQENLRQAVDGLLHPPALP